ncbi:uncharacterized protein LOC110446111 isoform X2 [Mizuhopecten yessoensis]|uniref:uncharacterized protein LOC110446111 isoform X2 n=1 Tax=Mizuhopecten yessoensis TaxID=6573 RepID=UPI000B45B948|nr:uncharacterized protein LOC110446111 isoform X2 [Mizuhopecten yessoensis]
MVSRDKMESKMSDAPLKSSLIMGFFIIQFVCGQRPVAVDTWLMSNRDRYVLSYTVSQLRRPHVSWWWKSTAQDSRFVQLQHNGMGHFRETLSRRATAQTDGSRLYDISLEISNINSSVFGEYKVKIDGNKNLTRSFIINEMPEKTSLDGLSEIPAASGGEDKFELSKSQVYIAVSVGCGILLVVALISFALVVRIKMKKSGRSTTSGDIQVDDNSGAVSISSHHYTDVHSTTGYEGLGEKQDTHEYLTTRNTTENRGAYNDPANHNSVKPPKQKTGSFANTMYGDPNLIITSGISPASLLKPVPKFTYKKKQNKARRFSDSTSDREDTVTYENVAKGGNSYENCNNLKRTKSIQ